MGKGRGPGRDLVDQVYANIDDVVGVPGEEVFILELGCAGEEDVCDVRDEA
jgi:hypothetical protein